MVCPNCLAGVLVVMTWSGKLFLFVVPQLVSSNTLWSAENGNSLGLDVEQDMDTYDSGVIDVGEPVASCIFGLLDSLLVWKNFFHFDRSIRD